MDNLTTRARLNRINFVRVLSTRELGVLCHSEYEQFLARISEYWELALRTREWFRNNAQHQENHDSGPTENLRMHGNENAEGVFVAVCVESS
jgi:hypothetical protein